MILLCFLRPARRGRQPKPTAHHTSNEGVAKGTKRPTGHAESEARIRRIGTAAGGGEALFHVKQDVRDTICMGRAEATLLRRRTAGADVPRGTSHRVRAGLKPQSPFPVQECQLTLHSAIRSLPTANLAFITTDFSGRMVANASVAMTRLGGLVGN
jgi:hypothetical protein